MSRLTLFNPIFLPTAYSPALYLFWREIGRWITCNYPTVLKEKSMEKRKEYNLHYLLAKARTTWGKASNRLRQWANKRNKNRVGRLPTLEQNRKIILSDEVRHRIKKGYECMGHNSTAMSPILLNNLFLVYRHTSITYGKVTVIFLSLPYSKQLW
jgi:hypothetical protein